MGTTTEASGAWKERDDLPVPVMAWLEEPIGRVLAIVATVDEDGWPRTAAFGAMRAVSPRRLRFSCRRSNATFRNLRRDGRVMVALYGDPDLAVGIRGHARVGRDIASLEDNVLVEVHVERVKNDLLPGLAITDRVTYAAPSLALRSLSALNDELLAPDVG